MNSFESHKEEEVKSFARRSHIMFSFYMFSIFSIIYNCIYLYYFICVQLASSCTMPYINK